GSAFVAGGVESMSNAPYLDFAARTGARYGHTQLKDALLTDGWWCSLENWAMGDAAEFIADQFEVTREEMDEFALESHRKAAALNSAAWWRKSSTVNARLTASRSVLLSTTSLKSAHTASIRRFSIAAFNNTFSTMLVVIL
ncbi:MAG: thiolase family protein, partial [Aggregatilineales bacterium]